MSERDDEIRRMIDDPAQSESAIRRRIRATLGSRVGRKSATKDRVGRSGQRRKDRRERPSVMVARKLRDYIRG